MKKAGKDERVWLVLRNIILLCGLILILFPLWLVLINSFKTLEEAGKNFFALPSRLNFDKYRELFANSNYWIFLRNSLKITVISIILILILVPSISYAIARNFNKKYYKTIYYYLLLGLYIPSQVVLLQVTKMMSKLNMLNHGGLILLYAAFSLTQGVFLFVNYIRGLPYEIEESAQIDGCSVFQTYVRIVLPLVKPMISTLLIMDVLWIWNDFMLPLLILNRTQEIWTLPLFQYNFKTEYSFNYGLYRLPACDAADADHLLHGTEIHCEGSDRRICERMSKTAGSQKM